MPVTKTVPVKKLSLDLRNYRTVRQKSESQAVQAMISISPDRFWALMDSLINDGYLPTENVLVIEDGTDSGLIVKEGNRRIAALKMIHGELSLKHFGVPNDIAEKVATLSEGWKAANKDVPCAVYSSHEADIVDKIVSLAHGKGEKAARDQWTAVARARHNRDAGGASEPALDLLEKYLKHGKNHTTEQAQRWAGNYPLTVLDEAMKKIAVRLGAKNSPDLATKYPLAKHNHALENILRDIGLEVIKFATLRGSADFAAMYAVPVAVSTSGGNPGSSSAAGATSSGQSNTSTGATQKSGSTGTGRSNSSKANANATNDPKAVHRTLKAFAPKGSNRDKVVTLRDEALRLKLDKNPIAFCFLLRSMFEISAKAYCIDQKAIGGPSCTDKQGRDRALADVLRDIEKHLTSNSQDKAMVKMLHGAMTDLAKPHAVLSVTSMNQLVHNPKFSITPTDVSTMFGNIFPLLEAMNS